MKGLNWKKEVNGLRNFRFENPFGECRLRLKKLGSDQKVLNFWVNGER